jgi:hypothetical protein
MADVCIWNPSGPLNTSSTMVSPSTLPLPPLPRTSPQARGSTSGRHLRSQSAWNRRFLVSAGAAPRSPLRSTASVAVCPDTGRACIQRIVRHRGPSVCAASSGTTVALLPTSRQQPAGHGNGLLGTSLKTPQVLLQRLPHPRKQKTASPAIAPFTNPYVTAAHGRSPGTASSGDQSLPRSQVSVERASRKGDA